LTTDQAILQRLFTTKSAKDCRQSVILQSVIVVPLSLLLYLTGIGLYAFYQRHPLRLAGLNNADAIMPFFAVHELPAGISGLIIASIFAASMAVMSAGINSLTTATTVDFYQRVFRPGLAPQHYAVIGRVGTLAWGVLVTLMALFAKYLGELALAYNRVSSFISGPLLGIFLLGTVTRRTTSAGALTGAAAGALTVALVSVETRWSFFYLGAIGVASTVAVGYLVSLCMAPPPAEKIAGLTLRSRRTPAEVKR
jgi:sodium-coupled monocarboxylate transporter 8/12